jgi:hypothetical protein
MPGVVYRVMSKTAIPFVNAGTVVWIARAIDISAFKEATLVVRQHAGTNVTGTGLQVGVSQDAPSVEDTADFVPSSSTPIGTPVTVSGSTANIFQVAPIGSANLPAFLRLQLVWQSGSAGTAVISVDIVAKS